MKKTELYSQLKAACVEITDAERQLIRAHTRMQLLLQSLMGIDPEFKDAPQAVIVAAEDAEIRRGSEIDQFPGFDCVSKIINSGE